MKANSSILIIPVLVLISLMVSCSKGVSIEKEPEEPVADNGQSPVISLIRVNDSNKFAGDLIGISATVVDSDEDVTDYKWSVSKGSYTTISNTEISWQSPAEAGQYTIELVVTDSKNNSNTKSVSVDLELPPSTFQKDISAPYVPLYSNSNIVYIDNHIYYYSSEWNGATSSSFVLRKYDLNGNFVWSRIIQEFPSHLRNILPVFNTSDGNILVVFDKGISKMDAGGNTLWSYETGSSLVNSFVELENGNYFFTGGYYESGSKNTFHILSPTGNLINEGPILLDEEFGIMDLTVDSESNSLYALGAANIQQNGESYFSVFIEMNPEGQVLSYRPLPYGFRVFAKIFQNLDNTFTAFFTTRLGNDAWVSMVNLNNAGDILDSKELALDSYTVVQDVYQMSTGEFLIGGDFGLIMRNTKSFALKIDLAGNIQWSNEFGEQSDLMDFCSGILELPDGKIIVSGSAFDRTAGEVKGYLHKYNADGSL